MKNRLRGMGLPSVLAVSALLFTLTLVLLGTTLSGHGLVDRLEKRTRARHLAEAVVQRAIAQLRADATFGLKPEASLTVTLPGDPEGAQGHLRFAGPDASHNNLDGQVAVVGWREGAVPPNSAWLVGVGTCAGVQSRVHVLLRRSAFPYVVASQGQVISTGATRVGSLSQMQLTEDTESLLPGHLVSNSVLEDGVQLGPSSYVSGDLRSAGGVILAPQAVVEGQTVSHGDAVPLPSIDLDSFDPLRNGTPYQDLPVLLSDQTLAGDCRASTDLTVQGKLQLEGATLFVNGNLVVTGGISGSGLVVVSGSVKVGGSVRLETNRHAVLLAGGDVELLGANQESSSFHGLVYTRGGLLARRIQLVGTFIANGSGRPTVLDNAQVVFDPAVGFLQGEPRSWLMPGSPSGKPAPVFSPQDWSEAKDDGAWLTGSGEGGTGAQLFNLNDFLGEFEPLEVVSWHEEV